jgi:hypothetical protein
VRWLLLVLHRSVLPVRIGCAGSVLRPLLTSASPTTACTAVFQAFGQALLPGAGQISPDKNVICRRASSCFTCEADVKGEVLLEKGGSSRSRGCRQASTTCCSFSRASRRRVTSRPGGARSASMRARRPRASIIA